MFVKCFLPDVPRGLCQYKAGHVVGGNGYFKRKKLLVCDKQTGVSVFHGCLNHMDAKRKGI